MPSTTQGRWEQNTHFSDMSIPFPANRSYQEGGSNTNTYSAPFTYVAIAAGSSSVFVFNVDAPFRTGQYATPGISQEQFGTAAAEPGPSSVSGTSGPLNLPYNPGVPPWKASQLPTVSGNALSGPVQKGTRLKSIDVTYEVDSVALTTAEIGVWLVKLPTAGNKGAPADVVLLTKGTNGLPTTTNTSGQATTTNVALTTLEFQITADSIIVVEVDITTPSGSTCKFYGITLNYDFNFN